jgi:biotin transporter BioY
MEVKKLTLIDAILPKIENKALALVKDILLVLSFTLLTAISAKIKIGIRTVPTPVQVFPTTGQTFSVLLCGALLGAKRGAISQFFYLLGAGISWLSSGDGMAYFLTSPTFGYIVGFVLAAFVVGFLCEKGFDRKIETAILAMLLGNILIYFPVLLCLARFYGWGNALAIGPYAFIIGDTPKLLLAASILPLGWKLIKVKS